MACNHNFQYAGVRYCNGKRPLPGSGATRRYYAHVYFCANCLEMRGQSIPDPGDYYVAWTSYDEIRFEAKPGTPGECGVPLEDQ